jgi:hypothetical protein
LAWGILTIAIFAGILTSAVIAQADMLQTIREDVRDGLPPRPAPSPSSDRPVDREPEESYSGTDWINCPSGAYCQNETNGPNDGSALLGGLIIGTGALVASPIWVPQVLLGDAHGDSEGFHGFPYDGAPCYAAASDRAAGARPLVVRLDVDYLETFDRLNSVNGCLLVETVSRFGLDTSWNHFEERLRSGGHDQLSLGDCNLVYRFAQSEWAQFRAGLGLNWLSDSCGADVGFNFTYGADLYPRKPWVLSATIDCGTLDRAGLFRFRTTAGVVFHGVETYAGYEYTDIGRTHWNGAIAGLRFWF